MLIDRQKEGGGNTGEARSSATSARRGKSQMASLFNKLHLDADRRKEAEMERKMDNESRLKEKFESATQKYSENNQVFLCIRITKELKTSYESDVRIDLSKKIAYPVFIKILALLGYLNSYKLENGELETKITNREENLV